MELKGKRLDHDQHEGGKARLCTLDVLLPQSRVQTKKLLPVWSQENASTLMGSNRSWDLLKMMRGEIGADVDDPADLFLELAILQSFQAHWLRTNDHIDFSPKEATSL